MSANMTNCGKIHNYELRENEIIKDNMIYCSLCGGQRLYELPDALHYEFGKYVRIACKCEQEQIKKQELERKAKIEMEKFEKLQNASLLGDRYKNVSFTTTDLETADVSFKKAFERCKNFATNIQLCLAGGYGMYIYGKCGCGKTHLVACLINDITKKGIPTLFTSFGEIIREIKKTFCNKTITESELLNKISKVPLLVIDDLGTERMVIDGEDSYLQEKAYEIVNKRYNAQKSTIFTSNYTMPQLYKERQFMKKTVDRIAEMSNAIIKIDSESYRLRKRDTELPF